ncbi:MAG TPA: class I SAM-dependent methyltransferase [Hyphomicrobium sp.]|nr:class I SAM-dependent methyltransferase [Hyphomicrobium sp.]
MSIETAGTADNFRAFYANKPRSYFSGARSDFVRRLPYDPSACILEIGCGTGATGALALAQGRCGRYVGVELFESAAEEARKVLSEVVTGNVESLQFPWQPAAFDALILSEVLEHLVEPGRVLTDLSRYVRQGGIVMASSPNVSHWRVVREIALGRFNLTDRGVFDRTHLRWFTPTTFAQMFEDAGFRIAWMGPVTPFSQRTRLLSRLIGGRFDHLFVTQIAIAGVRR